MKQTMVRDPTVRPSNSTQKDTPPRQLLSKRRYLSSNTGFNDSRERRGTSQEHQDQAQRFKPWIRRHHRIICQVALALQLACLTANSPGSIRAIQSSQALKTSTWASPVATESEKEQGSEDETECGSESEKEKEPEEDAVVTAVMAYLRAREMTMPQLIQRWLGASGHRSRRRLRSLQHILPKEGLISIKTLETQLARLHRLPFFNRYQVEKSMDKVNLADVDDIVGKTAPDWRNLLHQLLRNQRLHTRDVTPSATVFDDHRLPTYFFIGDTGRRDLIVGRELLEDGGVWINNQKRKLRWPNADLRINCKKDIRMPRHVPSSKIDSVHQADADRRDALMNVAILERAKAGGSRGPKRKVPKLKKSPSEPKASGPSKMTGSQTDGTPAPVTKKPRKLVRHKGERRGRLSPPGWQSTFPSWWDFLKSWRSLRRPQRCHSKGLLDEFDGCLMRTMDLAAVEPWWEALVECPLFFHWAPHNSLNPAPISMIFDSVDSSQSCAEPSPVCVTLMLVAVAVLVERPGGVSFSALLMSGPPDEAAVPDAVIDTCGPRGRTRYS